MRDIFYNTKYKIGSDEWIGSLNEGELAEWNWIGNNKQEIGKHREEFGLNDGWYLGRLLYALSFQGGTDKEGDFTKEDYTKGYAKFEISLDVTDNLELQRTLYDRIDKYYALLSDKGIMLDLKQDEKKVNSLINQYQQILDNVKNSHDNIKSSEPKRYDYRTAVLRRADFLFYQMKEEGIKSNHSILYMYKLYYQYEFDGIQNINEEFNYQSSLFDRIKTQRKRALKHFQHRL